MVPERPNRLTTCDHRYIHYGDPNPKQILKLTWLKIAGRHDLLLVNRRRTDHVRLGFALQLRVRTWGRSCPIRSMCGGRAAHNTSVLLYLAPRLWRVAIPTSTPRTCPLPGETMEIDERTWLRSFTCSSEIHRG